MRDKLNNSPIAQVALVAILLGAGAFLLLSGGGGGDDTASAPATSTPAAPTAPATSTPVAPSTTGGTALPADATGAAAATASGSVPVPPLPAPVRRAYAADETVVLLVVRGGGVDDKLVAPVVRKLRAVGGLAVFIAPAKDIARYAAITLGVDVNRVPALVVARPRALSGGTPQATVSYGFQSPAAIVQAVVDASYNGPAATYHPN
jgi:hypothetical protein